MLLITNAMRPEQLADARATLTALNAAGIGVLILGDHPEASICHINEAHVLTSGYGPAVGTSAARQKIQTVGENLGAAHHRPGQAAEYDIRVVTASNQHLRHVVRGPPDLSPHPSELTEG